MISLALARPPASHESPNLRSTTYGSQRCEEINKERYGNNMPPVREERRNEAPHLGPNIVTSSKCSQSLEDIVLIHKDMRTMPPHLQARTSQTTNHREDLAFEVHEEKGVWPARPESDPAKILAHISKSCSHFKGQVRNKSAMDHGEAKSTQVAAKSTREEVQQTSREILVAATPAETQESDNQLEHQERKDTQDGYCMPSKTQPGHQ